jgi:membrane associated rhomboid family serine protease
MTNSSRSLPASDSGTATSSTAQGRSTGSLRSALWVLLAISAMANVISGGLGLHPAVSVAFGVAALGAGAALVVDYYRRRRQS